jgi:hypothetical protein
MITRWLLRVVDAGTGYTMQDKDIQPFRQTEVGMLACPITGDVPTLPCVDTLFHLMEIWVRRIPPIKYIVDNLRKAGELAFDDIIEFNVFKKVIGHGRLLIRNRA